MLEAIQAPLVVGNFMGPWASMVCTWAFKGFLCHYFGVFLGYHSAFGTLWARLDLGVQNPLLCSVIEVALFFSQSYVLKVLEADTTTTS